MVNAPHNKERSDMMSIYIEPLRGHNEFYHLRFSYAEDDHLGTELSNHPSYKFYHPDLQKLSYTILQMELNFHQANEQVAGNIYGLENANHDRLLTSTARCLIYDHMLRYGTSGLQTTEESPADTEDDRVMSFKSNLHQIINHASQRYTPQTVQELNDYISGLFALHQAKLQ